MFTLVKKPLTKCFHLLGHSVLGVGVAVVEVIPPTGAHMHLAVPAEAVFSSRPGCQAVIPGSVPEILVRNSHSQSRNKL